MALAVVIVGAIALSRSSLILGEDQYPACQSAVARILDVLGAGEMFCIRRRAARETQQDISADGS